MKQLGLRARFSSKGVEVAQDFARARVESEISFMEKHDMNPSRLEEWLPRINFEGDSVDEVRVNIQGFEGKCTQEYLKQYFKLFPDFLKTTVRHQRGARDPLNNLMNLGYEILNRRVHVAVIAAHLDPYLGFLHSVQYGKPSCARAEKTGMSYLYVAFQIGLALIAAVLGHTGGKIVFAK